MKKVHQFAGVLKVVGVVVALIGLIPAMPGVVQADVQAAPAGIVSAGANHTCAVTPRGAVNCWGWNLWGQVVNDPGPYTQVSASDAHTCALTPGGALDCWGANDPYYDFGQVVNQPGPYIQVETGVLHTCALTPSGAVDCWGNKPGSDWGQGVGRPGPYVQLAVGLNHNCALKDNGAVECWGWNDYGQAVGQTGPYTQVSAGALQTCALTTSGAVDCWGGSNYGQAQDQDGPYIQVSAGEWHTCALKASGAVDCWGWDYNGQVSDTPENVSRFATHPGPYTFVSAGYFHTCALMPSGAVDCWGADKFGPARDQPGPYGQFDPRPYITTQPQSQTVTIGETASFSAAATGWPDPALQWQVSANGGQTWTAVGGAASPLEFTASLDQDGYQFRAYFINYEDSTTSNAATLTVVKSTATVMLSDLSHTYDGQAKAAAATTDPTGLAVSITYDGAADAPADAGDYAVVATVVDDSYQGSASATLTITPKVASVTPDAASKVYGDPDPALSGTLAGFVEADGVTASYSRTSGEAAGDYTISATLSPEGALDNYAITYHTAAFTIDRLAVAVAAEGKSKEYGQADPELTYTYSPQLVGRDAFGGALTRVPGEEAGTYAIRQGTLALSDNYVLTFAGAELTITPANTAPVAHPGGPYLGAVNTAIQFDGSGSSDPDDDPLTFAWTFGDGGTGTGATPAHTYTAAGLYDVCLTVDDGTVSSDPACTLAVVYDPSAGFVTGGGWIDSPAGAYKPDLNLSDQATFGFVSKYHKGQNVPTGTTEFQFDVAGFTFDSNTYEWLVVNQGGTNAQFKGSGTVNGGLDPNGNEYKFMIWATDSSPDTFHIRIWYEDGGSEIDVYDNGTDQAIGGGNIVVHTGK